MRRFEAYKFRPFLRVELRSRFTEPIALNDGYLDNHLVYCRVILAMSIKQPRISTSG
jgi:hypothetical protein